MTFIAQAEQMNKTIGIVAHVDAGKTTFTEQLLYDVQAIVQKGRVDHETSFLDHHVIEKERGITIFSDETTFTYEGDTYFLIDTPGHTDFSYELEQTLHALDYAILIVSATDGVQSYTKTIWKLLKKHDVRSFLFINKMDLARQSLPTIVRSIEKELGTTLLEMNDAEDESKLEDVAMLDEQLLHAFFEGDLTMQQAIQRAIDQQSLVLYSSGSALHGEGVQPFFHTIHERTKTTYDCSETPSGFIYKIRYDSENRKNCFIKLTKGTLELKDSLTLRGERKKIHEMRTYRGSEFVPVQRVTAGQLVALIGFDQGQVGDRFGDEQKELMIERLPAFSAAVESVDPSVPPHTLYERFQQLEQENPTLHVQWNAAEQTLLIEALGLIQLEMIEQLMDERYGIAVRCLEPTILYKETIATETMGYGHFEPLRHYAEVHVLLSPNPPGRGMTVSHETNSNEVTSGMLKEIKEAVLHGGMTGVATGSPLTDVHVTILAAKGHMRHTAPGDFKEATFRAMRYALERATTVVLEPMYSFEASVPSTIIGKFYQDVERAAGQLNDPVQKEHAIEITGEAPVATFARYADQFASLTSGKGTLSLDFSHYAPCHNDEEVIASIGYDRTKDPQFTSSSMFCTKGAGFSVPSSEVASMIHIDPKTYQK
ncbi:MAG TPA: translation factor GTPase family protein [Savagea sp.]